jgi:hypothetical protein
MGITIQSIRGTGPTMETRDLADGWVWLVLRRDPEAQDDLHRWHIQGVASDELSAIKLCVDENYMIGPLPMDNALPHTRVEWAGAYFPLREDDDPIKRTNQ